MKKNPKQKPPKNQLEEKRIFLVASARPEFVRFCQEAIDPKTATVYVASDGVEALFKSENVVPHVAILDSDLTRMDAFAVAEKLLEINGTHKVSIVLVTPIPDQERFVDEVVTGQVQFLKSMRTESDLLRAISRALDCVAIDGKGGYRLRFLAPQEVLFQEGEVAESVYFVKKGKLEAYTMRDNLAKLIGTAGPNEFIGEMAHLNGEPRSACVRAVEASELVEIPCDMFDKVLFSKPAWAKALVETLSRRLKEANKRLETVGAK